MADNNEKRCGNCQHWSTNDRIAEKYDEGWGYCSRNKDYFFYNHCAICFDSDSETQTVEEDTKVEIN